MHCKFTVLSRMRILVGQVDREGEAAVGDEEERLVQHVRRQVQREQREEIARGEDTVELLRAERDADGSARH